MPFSIRELLASGHVSAATRAAVQPRLDALGAAYEPQFLAPEAFALLEAVAARLLPQPERPQPIPLAPALDQRLAEGRADGWRYDALPPDREALRLGLGGIEEIAQAQFQQPFLALTPARQDAVIEALTQPHPPGAAWQALDPALFFEDLLAELTAEYYAHPLAQEEIGYAGLADLPKWSRIGLNEREEREGSAKP